MPEFSKGLEGVVAAETQMSFIDGQQGVLEYVGIAIGDLASSSTFEETVYLLWNKKLPTQAELDAFTKDLRANYDPPQGVLDMVKGMPKDAQPMHALRSLVSALSLFDDNPNANAVPAAREKALKLLAATQAIVAAFDRHRRGEAFVAPTSLWAAAQTSCICSTARSRPTP